MDEERLTKRAQETEEGGRRTRPTFRWTDSVKKDLEKAGVNSRYSEKMAEEQER